MVKIGSIETANPFLLAPLSGFTDEPFRIICRRFGASLSYVPLISATALSRNTSKTLDLMKYHETEHPIGLQIFGSKPQEMMEAAKIGEKLGFDLIDINAGCPAPKVMRTRAGAALMGNIDLFKEILDGIINCVSIPVTIKMRAGPNRDNMNCIELSKLAQELGVAAVAIHPRFPEDRYNGKANISLLAEAREVLSIPLMGSGDVMNYESAHIILEKIGCDAVLVARGCMGKPWLFNKLLSSYDRSVRTIDQTVEFIQNVLKDHSKLNVEHYGETRGIIIFRKQLVQYMSLFKGCRRMKNQVHKISTLEETAAFIEKLGPVMQERRSVDD